MKDVIEVAAQAFVFGFLSAVAMCAVYEIFDLIVRAVLG